MELFAIKNKDGLYSRGGSRPSWSKTPKVYTLGKLRQSLNFCGLDKMKKEYSNCIVEKFISESEINFNDFIESITK